MLNNFRIIPCLLVDDSALYKTVRFKDPKYIGDPVNAIKIFNEKEVDEIMVIDIGVTRNKRQIDFNLIEQMASECFMPMAYGGGIRTIEDVSRLFSLGIEKICIQTRAFENMDFISQVSAKYGNQAVIVSIDIKKDLFGKNKVYSYAHKKFLKKPWQECVTEAVNCGAGEILITCVDNEGMRNGVNLNLIRDIVEFTNVPVIGHGGVGSDKDIYDCYSAGASAVAAGSYFVLNGPHKAVLITYKTVEDIMLKFKSPVNE